jgi:hypothetical protein
MRLLVLVCAAVSGFLLNYRFPFQENDPVVGLIATAQPVMYYTLKYSWRLMLYTTPMVVFSIVFSGLSTFVVREKKQKPGELPPFPVPPANGPLQLVLGEVHHQREVKQVSTPKWLTIPERGMFAGIIIFGAIRSGKTSAAILPYARQIFGWNARDEQKKIGGLVLEVKGDLCGQVAGLLRDAGRAEDYIELNLSGEYVFNPMENGQDSFAQAYSIATMINQLYGKDSNPFWQQSYTNLIKFLLILHKVVDGYVTFFDVYVCATSPDRFRQKLEEGTARYGQPVETESWIVIDPAVYMAHPDLSRWQWTTDQSGMRIRYVGEIQDVLDQAVAPYRLETPASTADSGLSDRIALLMAVRRWYENAWMGMDVKLRTSIVAGPDFFLSLFDSDRQLNRLFCPPKEAYDPVKNADGRYGKPLPPISDLIESGKVLAVNFPMAANTAIARLVITLVKQEYQRCMLQRIPRMAAQPERYFRPSLFLADEYHELATVGAADPNGDEKYFAQSGQAKCIPVVATQSISSLRSTLPGETWRTLLQSFLTKIVLRSSDEFTAKHISEMAGRSKQLVPGFSMSESGNDVRIGATTGRPQAHKGGITLAKTWSYHHLPVFETKTIMELANAQCIAFAYDGAKPLPPTLLFLKPNHLDRNVSYFRQRERGLL